MYLRRWTKVPFHDALRLFKSTYSAQDAQANPLFQIKPVDFKKGYPQFNKDEDNILDRRLIRDLFNKYPEIRYLSLKGNSKDYGQETIITKFIRKQRQLIKDGYSIQKAFDITEQLYQQQMQRRIDSQLVSHELAHSNNARSFLNEYQQQSENESRLRALRATRDLELKRAEQKQHTSSQNPYDKDYDIEAAQQELSEKYEKTLQKMVPPELVQPGTNETQESLTQELMLRTKNLFSNYYLKASMKDRLNGLTDAEIQSSIMRSPRSLKAQADKILKKLDKYGIYLNGDRELVIPAGVPEKIKVQAQSAEFQAALMSRDIGFEQQHKQHLDTVEKKLSILRKEYQAVFETTSNDQVDGVLKYLKGTTVDIPRENTYKLFESQEQRLMRLEIKWWEQRAKVLEIQLLEDRLSDSPDPFVLDTIQEKATAMQKRLEDLVWNLRYTKFQVEQASIRSSSETIFAEHIDLTRKRGNFLNSSKLFIEDIEKYFTKPVDQRRATRTSSLNDDTITRLITRQPIPSGVHRLGEASPETQITKDDLINENAEFERQQELAREREQLRKMRSRPRVVEVDEDGEPVDLSEGLKEEVDLSALVEQRRKEREELTKMKAAEEAKREAELSKNKNLRKKKSKK